MDTKKLTLSINGETFGAMKEDFDYVLNRTLSNMKLKESEESVLTVKVKISLEKGAVLNSDTDKIIIKPKFEHKVSSTMNTKCERKGVLYGEYELVYDDEGECVMCHIDSGQLSLLEGGEE